MPSKPRIIFVNQVTGYLFIDVVNAFADDYQCELYAGQVDQAKAPLKGNVSVHKLIRYDRNKPIKRIITWGIFTLQLFFRLLFKAGKYELFIVSNPPFAPFVGYLLNKIRSIKYHLLVYDVYPDALVNFGIIKKGSLAEKWWSRRNKKLYTKASTIITLSDGMSALIRQYHPDASIEVIHNWADTSFIKPVDKKENSFAREYGQVEKITVIYSGNMGATHAVEKIAELAIALKTDTSFGFLAIGDGVKKATIEKMKQAEQLDNLVVLPYQSADVLPFSLACADIGIVTLSSGAEDLSVPSKTYNLLAAGVALLVIASPNSELAKLVTTYKCGVQFQEQDLAGMMDFLKDIKNDPSKLSAMKANARNASFQFTPANAFEYPKRLNSNLHVS